MSVVVDLLRSAGAPEKVVIAAVILLIGWQLWKLQSVARFVSALLGNAVGYVFVVLIVSAAVVGLGWVRIDVVVAELSGVVSGVVEFVLSELIDRLVDVLADRVG